MTGLEVTVKAVVDMLHICRCGTGVYTAVTQSKTAGLVTSQEVDMTVAGVDVVDSVLAEECIPLGLMEDLVLYTLSQAFGFNCPIVGLYWINGD